MSPLCSLFFISALFAMVIAMEPSWFPHPYDICSTTYGAGEGFWIEVKPTELFHGHLVGRASLATLAIISTIPFMKDPDETRRGQLQEVMKSFRRFIVEAVMKPGQPLGMEMFSPWKSGNWKGALQQWLVIHLYQWTLMSLALVMKFLTRFGYLGFAKGPIDPISPWNPYMIVLVLNAFCTWHFWFALTQRRPTRCFVPAAGHHVRAVRAHRDRLHFVSVAFRYLQQLAATRWCASICGICLPVILVGSVFPWLPFWLAHAAYGLRVSDIPSVVPPGWDYADPTTGGTRRDYADCDYGGQYWVLHGNPEAIFIACAMALLLATQLALGLCLVVIGCKGLVGNQDSDGKTEQTVEKRDVSKETVSTGADEGENPSADGNVEEVFVPP
jgi:hypothetical protein